MTAQYVTVIVSMVMHPKECAIGQEEIKSTFTDTSSLSKTQPGTSSSVDCEVESLSW